MTESRECFGWMEIGRAVPDGGAPWTVWMALLPDGGALYRTLLVADAALTVTVELQPHHGAGMRTLHKGRRHLSPRADGDAMADDLLTTAEEAAWATLACSNATGGTRPRVAIVAGAVAGRWPVQPAVTAAAADARGA